MKPPFCVKQNVDTINGCNRQNNVIKCVCSSIDLFLIHSLKHVNTDQLGDMLHTQLNSNQSICEKLQVHFNSHYEKHEMPKILIQISQINKWKATIIIKFPLIKFN